MPNEDQQEKSVNKGRPAPEHAPESSLVEALQALAADMAGAETELDAKRGLDRLQQIKTVFLQETADHSDDSFRRSSEALIAWMESRLIRLHRQLARKRRALEDEVLEKLARQREAEGPSLLPTELIDAIVHSTREAEKDKTAAAEAPEPAAAAGKRPPEKARRKKKAAVQKAAERKADVQKPAEQNAEAQKAAEKPAEKPAEQPEPAVLAAKEEKPAEQPAPAAPAAKEKRPEARKPEWTKSERLAAHLAASVREDGSFFEKLRKSARRNGPGQKAPEDQAAAERYHRTVHSLNKRLVNLELHAKALARAEETREPVSPLLRGAAKELKHFMREFQAGKEALPEMSGEMERLFGGWAEHFRSMRPEKGEALLAKCRKERQPEPQAAPRPQPPAAEPDAPQLVLKPSDDWQ